MGKSKFVSYSILCFLLCLSCFQSFITYFFSRKSEEQSYSYRNASQTQLHFDQTYQIEKFGPSPLNEISVVLNIPHIFRTKGRDIEFISLSAPNSKLNNEGISCSSNFKYIPEKTVAASGSISDNDINNHGRRKRFVEQVEVFNDSTVESEKLTNKNGFNAFQNRTFYINCSMPEIDCSPIRCSINSLKNNELANIYLQMVFNISAIKGRHLH